MHEAMDALADPTLAVVARSRPGHAQRDGHVGERRVAEAGPVSNSNRAAVERAVMHMRASLDSTLDLERLSRVAAISKFHFIRVFESVTGVTPHQFLACLRIERSKQLLRFSNDSVTDACFAVGYKSLGSFSAAFAESVGMSPAAYRRGAPVLRAEVALRMARKYVDERRQSRGDLLIGEVRGVCGDDGLVFVGAFDKGAPRGAPIAGAIMIGPGRFQMRRPDRDEYYLLAACLPYADAAGPDAASLEVRMVASSRIFAMGGELPLPCLVLRRPRVTDPPIVFELATLV